MKMKGDLIFALLSCINIYIKIKPSQTTDAHPILFYQTRALLLLYYYGNEGGAYRKKLYRKAINDLLEPHQMVFSI